jgi:hypothetical protein
VLKLTVSNKETQDRHYDTQIAAHQARLINPAAPSQVRGTHNSHSTYYETAPVIATWALLSVNKIQNNEITWNSKTASWDAVQPGRLNKRCQTLRKCNFHWVQRLCPYSAACQTTGRMWEVQNNRRYVHLTWTIAQSMARTPVFYLSAFGYNASREATSYSLLHKLRATHVNCCLLKRIKYRRFCYRNLSKQ